MTLWRSSIGSDKTGFNEIDVFKFITGFDDYFSLGKFLGGELGKEFFYLGELCFRHMQLAIIYHKIICKL